MKLVSKIIVLIVVAVVLGFTQLSCMVDQVVWNTPISNVNGAHWYIYNLTDPEGDFATETSSNCVTFIHFSGNLMWSAEIGFNFHPPQPELGDSLIIVGSWDSAYVNNPGTYGYNPNHTGFYWLYSDILHDDVYDAWPADTMRPLPKPIASQVGGPYGDIQISITNPDETRYTDEIPYSVLGFWIWADTTGEGTPDAFNDELTVMEVGFFSVDGDTGDITICTHPVSNYHDGHTVYWAYKLVARPSFSLKGSRQAPGYTTYYFSQNSDPIVIIGIEENTNLKPGCVKLEISPNPFTDRTDIRFQITENQRQEARSKNQEVSLEIYDCSGRMVKSFNLTSVVLLHASAVPWYGTDESGEQLPSGVYFVQAKSGDLNLTRKVILQR